MAAINWKSGVSGDWNTASDWSGAVPGASDTVTIAAAGSYTVTIDNNEAAQSITLNAAGAKLVESGKNVTLTLGTGLTVSAGTLSLVPNLGGTQQIDGGSVNVSSNGVLTVTLPSGAGSSEYATYINSAVDLEGTTNIGTQTLLALNGGGVLGGTFAGLGELGLNGSYIANGASFSGLGSLVVSAGGLFVTTNSGSFTNVSALDGSTLSVASGLTATVSSNLTIGTDDPLFPEGSFANVISGPGTLVTTSSADIYDNSMHTTELTVGGGLTWVNSGSLNIQGAVAVNQSQGDSFTLVNDASGTIFFEQPGELALQHTGSDLFTNAGTLESYGNVTLAIPLDSTGLIDPIGSLTLTGGGTLGGELTDTGTLVLGGIYTLATGGFGAGPDNLGSGNLALNDGVLNVGSSSTFAGGFGTDGGNDEISLKAGADFTLSGAATIGQTAVQNPNLYIIGPGTLTTLGVTTLDDAGSGVSLIGDGTWINGGALTDNAVIDLGDTTSASDVETFVNQAGATFSVVGPHGGILINGAGTGVFDNFGTLVRGSDSGTSTIAAYLSNTGTIDVTSGTLALTGGGTITGELDGSGTLLLSAGHYTVASHLAGNGHLVVGAGATLTNVTVLDGNTTLTIAAGKTMTYSTGLTIGDGTGGVTVNGGGMLSTTGATTVTDAGLPSNLVLTGGTTWTNSSTVTDGGVILYDAYATGGDSAKIVNSTTGTFNLSSDNASFGVNGGGSFGTNIFTNAGLLTKTTGFGTNVIGVTFNNTGTVNVTSGSVSANGGGAIGGTISGTGFQLGGGAFTTGGIAGSGILNITAGASLTGTTATASIAAGVDLVANGAVDSLAGKTVTLAGQVVVGTLPSNYLNPGYFSGPGIVSTTASTYVLDAGATNTELVVDGGVTWANTDVVSDAGFIAYDAYATGGDAALILNKAGGSFNFTNDDANVGVNGGGSFGTNVFTNQGTLAKTGGTAANTISVSFTNTGLVNVTAGAIDLTGGGTIGGTLAGAGVLDLASGAYTIASTGVSGAGTLEFAYGSTITQAAGTKSTIASNFEGTGGVINGTGTITTSGPTAVLDSGTSANLALSGGITWVNTGTVTATGLIAYNAYATGGDSATIVNAATGQFILSGPDGDIGDNAGGSYGTDLFNNAGTLTETGSGTGTLYAAIADTGTLNAASGTLALLGGGVVGGSILGAGITELAAGAYTTSGIAGAGTLAVTGGASLTGTITGKLVTETVAPSIILNNAGTIGAAGGDTLVLSGAITAGAPATTYTAAGGFTGAGTITTTNAVSVVDNAANLQLAVENGATWANAGTVNDAGLIAFDAYATGNDTATISNSGTFDFTSADAGLVVNAGGSYGTNIFNNTGTLAKISSTGTNVINVALNSSGAINVQTGVIDITGLGGVLNGSVTGAGLLQLETGTYTTHGLTGAGNLQLDNAASLTGTTTTGTLAQTMAVLNGGLVGAAAGDTISLAGAVTLGATASTYVSAAAFSGAGTLTTTNLVSILDNAANLELAVQYGATWNNVSVTNDAGLIAFDAYATGNDTATILNTGTFNFTTDDAGLTTNAGGSYGTNLFSNTGTLAKTAGTGTNTIVVAFNTTGLVNVAAGTITLTGGGTIGGTLTGAGTLQTGANTYAIATGGLAGSGTLTLGSGTILGQPGNSTIATTLIADGASVIGGGTLTTTGATTLADLGASTANLAVGSGSTWVNGGTVTDSGFVALFAYAAGNDTAYILNKAGATFALTGADASIGVNAGGSYGTDLFTNNGLVTKTGPGLSTISVPLLNSGTVDANAGTLALTGTLTGTGNLKIDAGATLEVGNLPTTQHVTFTGGAGATLKLDTPASIGSLTAFTAGDRLDLAGLTVTAAKITGTTLTVTAGGVNTTYISAGLTGEIATFGTDKTGGSFVSIYRTASATHTPEPLAFGNHHVGDKNVSLGLTVSNTAIADGYSEKLNATLGGATAGFTGAGTVTALAAGASNSTSLTVAFDTSTAGAKTGTATLTLATNGTGVDGRGANPLAPQTVNLTGAVYNYAAGSLTSTAINLGNHHVGDSASAFLTLTNSAAAGAFSEGLDASFTSKTGSASTSGSINLLTAGSSNSTSLGLGLAPTTAGIATGTGVLTYVSDGTGTSGLGTTTLGTQSVSATGTFYNLATGKLASTTIAFGNHHVGDIVAAKTLSLTNNAATGGFSEALDAKLTATGGLTASGSISGLGAGVTDTTSLSIGETAATAGLITGNVVVGLISDGTGIDGLGTTTLLGQTVTVTGANYNLASALVGNPTINLGVIHTSTAVSTALTLTNTAATGGFSEALDAKLGSNSTPLTVGGTITGLGAGVTDTTTLSVILNEANSGLFTGGVTLLLASDGTGTSGLGTTSLGSQTVNISATVDNYALAAFEDPSGPALTGTSINETLNLGSVIQGGAALTATIGALNAQTGLSDLLGGTLTSTGGAGFTNSGLGTFSGLAAGQDEHAQSVSLSTSTAGTFTETIVLSSYGTNASGYNGALANETLTITGTITPSTYTTYTLTAGPNTILGTDGKGDIFIAAAGALNSYDHLTGGNGANTLTLAGAGLFDIGAAHLANIPNVTAKEGQAASGTLAATRQTVLLSDSVSQTVTVLAGTAATGNANPIGISIYNDTGTNTVKLSTGGDAVFGGTGNLTVTVGSTANKVTAGGGTLLVRATAAQGAVAVIGATTGQTTLELTTGGAATLNAADTDLTVKLDAASTLKLGALGFITAVGSAGVDSITAGGGNQILTGGAGLDTLTGFTGGGDTFSDTAAGLNGDTINNWITGDQIDLQNIVAANLHALSLTGNKLTVTDGTTSSTIAFGGSVTLANFTVIGSDGHGGTLLGYHG